MQGDDEWKLWKKKKVKTVSVEISFWTRSRTLSVQLRPASDKQGTPHALHETSNGDLTYILQGGKDSGKVDA